MNEENDLDVCSKCGLVELPEDYPYYHCEECRKSKYNLDLI